jgi:hypothetical protein
MKHLKHQPSSKQHLCMVTLTLKCIFAFQVGIMDYVSIELCEHDFLVLMIFKKKSYFLCSYVEGKKSSPLHFLISLKGFWKWYDRKAEINFIELEELCQFNFDVLESKNGYHSKCGINGLAWFIERCNKYIIVKAHCHYIIGVCMHNILWWHQGFF